jgi:hypothetical protein
MGGLGTCETGCKEERLDLVRAQAHDSAVDVEQACLARAALFTPIAEEFIRGEPTDDEWEATYLSLQKRARGALRAHPETRQPEIDLGVPSEAAITWWCSQCGAVDAPQPCLGICVWRPVAWVRKDLYDRQRERALAQQDRERVLRRLVRRVASVTPRASQWRRNWQALRTEAAEALSDEGHLGRSTERVG